MTSIESWLENQFYGSVLRGNGDELRVNCPFPHRDGADTKYHMHVNVSKPVAHCFKCNWGGTHFELVRQVTGAESYAEVYLILQGQRTSLASYTTVVEQLRQRRREAKSVEWMPKWFKPFGKNLDGIYSELVLQYAIDRRISIDDILKHKFGYCTDMDCEYAMRLVMPVERGYFQARSITENSRDKYLSPGTQKEDRLFNYQALDSDELVICEGIISALASGSSAVALLGKVATPKQAQRLAQSRAKRVVLAMDADAVGDKAVSKLAKLLDANGKEVLIRQYEQGDPADGYGYVDRLWNLQYEIERMFSNGN